MTSKKIIVLILFSLVSLTTFSQGMPGEEDMDILYTPGVNSILNEEAAKKRDGHSKADMKTAIKIVPSMLIRNIIVFGAERLVLDNMSLSAFIGYKYKLDFTERDLLGFGDELDMNLVVRETDLEPYMMIRNSVLTGTNMFWKGTVKVYLDYVFDDYYFELGFRSYSSKLLMNSDVFTYSYDGTFLGDKEITIRYNTFFLNVGNEINTSGQVKMTHEWWVGIGIKKMAYDIVERTETGSIWYYSDDYWYQKTGERESKTGPIITLGYALGFGF